MTSQEQATMTFPKAFRNQDDFGPKTPEPLAPSAGDQSLPPTRPRLRLKRRHASQVNAPTQQFLASIAAADIPIPSVEDIDREMIDTMPGLHVEDFDTIDVCRHLTPRMFSPPKTPAIDLGATLGQLNYPDWYSDSTWSDSDLDSSSDVESSRPSTAFSTQTSSSSFSRYSRATDDAHCISPDLEAIEFPHKAESKNAPLRSGQDNPRKAPWTRAMSAHLWATYLLYLSDPKVTPIRLGKSCIPPHGVCVRVARQAQRSWKGSKSQSASNEIESRNSTPTAESSKTYIQWPHTGGATRAHLRELCKMKASNKAGRYLSRSPTPFNKPSNRRWNHWPIPTQSTSVFSGQDMAMSLTLSASDTMQSHGPLAQLTRSQPPPRSLFELGSGQVLSRESHQHELNTEPPVITRVLGEPLMDINDKSMCHNSDRLGSPFLAKSYGPSSSSTAAKVNLPKQSNTVVGSRTVLRSPARFTRSRSRSGTQKRRSFKSHEEQAWKRPSLAAAFCREGSRNSDAAVVFSSPDNQAAHIASERRTASDRLPQQATLQPESTTLPETPTSTSRPFVVSAISPQQPSSHPARLGSPFSAAASSSFSFPSRLSPASNFNLAALYRPFATVQQTQVSTVATPTPVRPNLASRMAYIDQRLKELRNRGSDGQDSQSPS